MILFAKGTAVLLCRRTSTTAVIEVLRVARTIRPVGPTQNIN